MTTPLDLTALRALADAAAPGPWTKGLKGKSKDGFVFSYVNTANDCVAKTDGGWNNLDAHANAAFIAASRTAIPALCDELAAARERIKRLEEALRIFVIFLGFTEAGRELDGDPPAKDTEYISYFSGNGASAGITIGDLRKARAALSPEAIESLRSVAVEDSGMLRANIEALISDGLSQDVPPTGIADAILNRVSARAKVPEGLQEWQKQIADRLDLIQPTEWVTVPREWLQMLADSGLPGKGDPFPIEAEAILAAAPTPEEKA